MKNLKLIVVSITQSITLAIFFIASVSASDLQREKRMAEELVGVIFDGEAVFMKVDSHEFLSIYTQAEEAKGAAVILHGRGFHPDWQDAINPLRVGLAESGWNTLSVQMPVLEKQAKYYDYVPLFSEALPRIDAAIKYVRSQGADKVVLIAHSCGVHMAMAWAEAQYKGKQSQKIDAFVGIGMGATDYQQPMAHPFPLDKLAVPVLDVYADGDYPAVIKNAAQRFAMIQQAGNKLSRQIKITGANHYYEDKGEALTQAISQWLETL